MGKDNEPYLLKINDFKSRENPIRELLSLCRINYVDEFQFSGTKDSNTISILENEYNVSWKTLKNITN